MPKVTPGSAEDWSLLSDALKKVLLAAGRARDGVEEYIKEITLYVQAFIL